MKGGTVQYNQSGLADGVKHLTAVPFDGYTFKHFILDGEIVTDNPAYTSATTIDAVFYVTISSYLKGLTQFIIKDSALIPIAIHRGFSLDTDVSLVNERARELAKADLYVYIASSPSSFTGHVEKDFYWEHRESSYSMSNADKKFYLRLANEIYAKYGESKRGASLTLINL